jgi:5'-methylthioadenosine phosphorylase
LIVSAKELDLRYHAKGTVITIEGPRFSSKAESNMFRMFGADVINMSTVPEVILARELGICYQSIAMSTDYDCWKEGEEHVTADMVFATMAKNAGNVKDMLLKTIPKIKMIECACRQ